MGTGMGICICICIVIRMGMCVDTCIDMYGWVWLALVSQPSILGSLAQPQNEGTWSPTKTRKKIPNPERFQCPRSRVRVRGEE